ncbi:MAG: tetratricopeptide repeat protein [Chloroflexi bacterium]|nr:tetratricopeptide repeat protein [Chloroflexota bacterium]
MLGKLGGGGDLIPAALRWLRRRSEPAAPTVELQSAPQPTITQDTAPAVDASTLTVEPTPPAPLPTADDVGELRALVEMHRNDPKLRWQLGLSLVAARKLNLALAHLEVAASQDPDLDQGELADVREAQRAERQVRRYPRDPELRLVLGRLYLALDQGDAALAELEEAARLDPKLAPAHTLLGFEYAYRGRIARAREHWGRARDLDPADEMSKTGLEAIQDGRDPLRAIWQAASS